MEGFGAPWQASRELFGDVGLSDTQDLPDKWKELDLKS